MDECLFCKIAAGEIPSNQIAENEHAVAFHDINPAAPVHLLVIPRVHVQSIADLAGEHREAVAGVMELVRDAAQAAGLLPGGYRVVSNTGADAGQMVPHLHFHVLGGRKLAWPPG